MINANKTKNIFLSIGFSPFKMNIFNMINIHFDANQRMPNHDFGLDGLKTSNYFTEYVLKNRNGTILKNKK